MRAFLRLRLLDPVLVALFREDPAGFLQRFGLTGLHGILGWLAIAPLVAGVLYLALLPLLRRAGRRFTSPTDAAA